ncbi:MAG: LiaF transmembrane domain-containing protein [Candidatus Dojkabacteria bacterium]|jgi:predicted membrane protein
MKNFNKVFWGIALIAIGVIYGLKTLEIVNINIFFNGWWTLFIIIPGLVGLIKGKDITGNLIVILIGFSILLLAQGLISFDKLSRLIIPIILVTTGLIVLFKNKDNTTTTKKIKEINKDGKPLEYFSTFSGQKIVLEEEVKNLELSAIFGGITCDLRNAIIKEDVAMDTTAIFGGIDILVPDDVNVKVVQTAMFGGVDNKREGKKEDKSKKTIYINSTCIFGGVEIK